MTTTALGSTGLSEPMLAALRSAVRGQVTAPGDTAWESARTAWNLHVDQRPAAVVQPVDGADLAAAVAIVVAHDAVVAAQPGGHGATSAIDGAVLLRTSSLQELEIDAALRVARVGAGVKWGTLLAALEGTGLVARVGSNPDVSVVGYTLSGGLSWFGRAFGLGSHALRAVELVGADGSRRWVDDASDPDLMWALRGAGGVLGVVTAVELWLDPAPELYGGRLLFPAVLAPEVLRAFAAITPDATDASTVWATLLQFPPIPEIPEPLRGNRFVALDLVHVGDEASLGDLLAPVRALGPPVLDTMGPLALSAVGDIAAEPVDPVPAMISAGLLERFDGETVDRLLGAFAACEGLPLVSIQLRHLGGALARAGTRPDGADVSSIVAPVTQPYLVNAVAMVPAPPVAPASAQALVHVEDAVAPVVAPRVVASFLEPGQTLRDAYDADPLARLRAVKARVDPQDRIRGNYPVPPA